MAFFMVIPELNPNQIRQQFDKIRSIPREDLLPPTTKESNKMFPLVLDYNPNLPSIGKSCTHPTGGLPVRLKHKKKKKKNILFMSLPPLLKYSPRGLLFHRSGDLKTFKPFFHAPTKLTIVALTSVVALNAKVNAILVVIC